MRAVRRSLLMLLALVALAVPATVLAQYEGRVIACQSTGQVSTCQVAVAPGETVVLTPVTTHVNAIQVTFTQAFNGKITITETPAPPTASIGGPLALVVPAAAAAPAVPSGVVVTYLAVDFGGAPSSVVAKAAFDFRAPASLTGVALQTTGANAQAGPWTTLPTAQKATDGSVTTYTATSQPLFSLYAIVGTAAQPGAYPNTGQGSMADGTSWGPLALAAGVLAIAAAGATGLTVLRRRTSR